MATEYVNIEIYYTYKMCHYPLQMAQKRHTNGTKAHKLTIVYASRLMLSYSVQGSNRRTHTNNTQKTTIDTQ